MLTPLLLSLSPFALLSTQDAETQERLRALGYVSEPGLSKQLVAAVDPERLRKYHDVLAGKPHDAGTAGDLAVVEFLAETFASFGLDVEKHEIHVLLSEPVDAAVILKGHGSIGDRELPVTENHGDDDGNRIGWNAYSASGQVEAEVVYANHGTKEDFETLARLGVDCRGKIVLARYGGNYRGYKAKYAEEAGAAGLIIYTDPKDSGYGRGLVWPEGGYANGRYIQRGSIKTLPYYGDPTTPFVESTAEAQRLPVESLALPKIPVQPIGYGAARYILERMTGDSVPQAWQGGLPCRYRLTGGPTCVVSLRVEQKRSIKKTYNVLGTLRGAEEPQKQILIGAHHDSWGHGASDSASGLISVLEAARVWSEVAKAGQRPRRSLTFVGWGAEEFGIIGSVEYVESRLEHLRDNAVCYLNLDMASMGTNFRSSSSPALQEAIRAAMAQVPQPYDERGRSVAQVWSGGFGDLGGGSDHVGFLALAGVPCASLNGGGSAGTSYHSQFDTLEWYRKVVGDDYEAARLVARAALAVSARFADEALLPLDPAALDGATRRHLEALTRRGRALEFFEPGERPIAVELAAVEGAALVHGQRSRAVLARLRSAATNMGPELALANALLQDLDRMWLHAPGLPNRPWYRNLYTATDETSGYAAWILPLLRHAIEHDDREAFRRAEARYRRVFAESSAALDVLAELADRAALPKEAGSDR